MSSRYANEMLKEHMKEKLTINLSHTARNIEGHKLTTSRSKQWSNPVCMLLRTNPKDETACHPNSSSYHKKRKSTFGLRLWISLSDSTEEKTVRKNPAEEHGQPGSNQRCEKRKS